MSTLAARDLTVEFRQRGGPAIRAVDCVSLALEAGTTVALVGESGSGKSTVVRVLGRLLSPTSGEILLDDRRVRRGRRQLGAYRRRVQMIFQDPFASLNPAHSVEHHVSRPLRVHGQATRHTIEARVDEVLESVNLVPPRVVARRYPHELSGGQRQRVAIARSLAPSPDVLLADEPVSMLDVSIRLEILHLLDELKVSRNLALLYVTHDLATARHFSSEIMVMYRGEIVERGPSDAVILSPAHPYTQLLASAAPDPRSTRAELAEARRARRVERADRPAERRELVDESGCRFRARCPFAMEICRRPPPELAAGHGQLARCWLHDPATAGNDGSTP